MKKGLDLRTVPCVVALTLSVGLFGCGANQPVGASETQGTSEDAPATTDVGESDDMHVAFDDVVLIDNEYMTMWLTGFTKWVGTMNGVPNTTEYYLDVKVENKGDMAFVWYAGDAYIGSEGVHASIVNGNETRPGKTREWQVSVCRDYNPYEPIDSMDDLYDLEFEVEANGLDEDYYGDDYMHEIFTTRVNIYDYVTKPSK